MFIKAFDLFLSLYFYLFLGLFFTDYTFISNLTGHAIGLAVLFALRYFFNKDTFPDIHPLAVIRKVINSGDKTILSFAAIVLFVLICAVAISRHLALSSASQDLGIFDQAVWNTTQGRLLFSSLKGNMSLLGDHFEPILLFIAPLYLLWSSPLVLLILQALCLASALVPLFLIGQRIIKERALLLSFVLAYMLSKPLRGVGFSDFHPECFIVPLLFWAYYFLLAKRNRLFLIMIFLLLLCKEDAVIYVGAFGLFIWLKDKNLRLGLSLCIIAIVAWILETKFIIPYFNSKGIYPYMDRLPFGETYIDNIKVVFSAPWRVLKLVATSEKLEYCFKMLGPLGFLSLFSPAHYIFIALPFLRNLMPQNTAFSGYYNITSHYTTGLIPFIFISAFYGADFIVRRFKAKGVSNSLALLIVFFAFFFFGKTDGHKFSRFISTIRKENTLKKIAYLKTIPPDASVSANFNLVPHLSQRKYIFEWHPDTPASAIAEYVVIDRELLEYILVSDLPKVDDFIQNAAQYGYQVAFKSADGQFLILHNPGIDKSLVEAVF